MGSAPFEAEQAQGPVKLRFHLLPWQQKARRVRAKRPLVVVNSGVYTGKTVWGACELLDDMLQHSGATFWWVAGLKFQLDAMWETFAPHVQMLGGRLKAHPYLFAQLPNGARVFGVSAENVDLISAHHPVAIYGDEVAKWRERAWHFVRVRLLNQGVGRALFLSTPRPNFWRDLVRWGRQGRDGRWGLVECATPKAGLVAADQIEALRRDLPEELFQQEIMARILEGAGMVFRKVREAATGAPEGPQPGRTYVIGYDPAKLRDFAVAVVRCDTRIVCMERWAEMDYLVQADRIAELSKRYNEAVVHLDVGGPGQPIAELLRNKQVTVEAVTFTTQSKEDMINKLCLKFEQGELVLPSVDFGEPYTTLVDECTAYERRRSSGGLHYSYSAPEGAHDDCVSALLLAVCAERKVDGVVEYYRRLYYKEVAPGLVSYRLST